MFGFTVVEGSNRRGALLYRPEEQRFGLALPDRPVTWDPATTSRYAACLGSDCTGVVYSGEIGEWTTTVDDLEPRVWPALTSTSRLVPPGVEVADLTNYRVLVAPGAETYAAIGRSHEGANTLWAVENGRLVLTRGLSTGELLWTPSHGQNGGSLYIHAEPSALALRHGPQGWDVHLATLDVPVLSAALLTWPHQFVLTPNGAVVTGDDDGAPRLDTDLQFAGEAYPTTYGFVIAARRSTDRGVTTFLEAFRSGSGTPVWRVELPQEALVYSSPGSAEVYAGTKSGSIRISGEGETSWASPDGGPLVVLGSDGALFTLDETGRIASP